LGEGKGLREGWDSKELWKSIKWARKMIEEKSKPAPLNPKGAAPGKGVCGTSFRSRHLSRERSKAMCIRTSQGPGAPYAVSASGIFDFDSCVGHLPPRFLLAVEPEPLIGKEKANINRGQGLLTVLISTKIGQPKNLRKISEASLDKIVRFKKGSFVAACVRKIPASAILRGDFAHLGIVLKGNKVEFPESQVPRFDRGRYSKLNVEGEEIVRKDLPLETHSHTVEAPDWGRQGYGTHAVDLPHKAYPREHVPPSENEIAIEFLGKEDEREPIFVLKFVVSEVMDRSKRKFQKRLFFNLNLLLENAGAVDVFQSDAKFEDYMKTLYVHWEILPPGERDANIAKILQRLPDTPEVREKILDRYEFLEKLNPENFIQGLGGFKRYFGAKFSDRLVVFENMEYGNAIYAMFADWENQSKKTRQELLASGREGKDFIRVPHLMSWKGKVREIVKERRKRSERA
jgi:hypothetical protein